MDNPINKSKDNKFSIIGSLFAVAILCLYFLSWYSEYIPILFFVVLLLPALILLRSKELNKFKLEFTERGIVIYQFWEKPFTIPFESITRVYLHKGPMEKVWKATNLVIEFGEKHTFIDRIIYWGPKSALYGLFSPGIWGNYCTIPNIDDLKAEELKDKILSYTGDKVEVKRIGLFYI